MKAFFSGLVLLFFVPCFALAQEAQPGVRDSLRTSPRYTVEPVIVTATRQARPVLEVPYAVNVLDKDDIQRAEAGISLEEALRALPGIVVQNRYNLSQGDRVSLRGIGTRAPFGVRGLKIIQDGIPLTFADGQSQLNNIDLSSAGHIEVLRGPSSSLYGNAAGGLIDLQTQVAADAPFRLQPRFLAGSDGLRKWQGKISGRIGRSRYLVNVNTLWQDGYRDHAAARSTNVNAVGRHTLSRRLSLTTLFNFYDAPYLFNPSSLDRTTADTAPTSARGFVQRQGASKDITQGQGGVTLHYEDAINKLGVTLYGVGRSLFNPIPGRIIDLGRKAGGVRTVFSRRTRVAGASLEWTAGADFEFQDDTRKEFKNKGIPADRVGKVDDAAVFGLLSFGSKLLDQDEQVLGIGPFAQLEFAPRPDWLITAGGRYDRFRFEADDHFLEDGVDDSGTRTMDQFSPMAGVTYRPRPTLSLYGNFATAFQTPTTNELGNRPTGAGGFNPDLDPERIRSFEAGFKGLWPEHRLRWDAAFYVFRVDDLLIPFQIDDPASEEIFFRNAGKAQNTGMEINLGWTPLPGLRTSLSYTLMNFEFEDFQVEREVNNTRTLVQLKGNNVPGVPPQHLYAGAAYTRPGGAYGEADLQWFDSYFANDFNGPPPGGAKPARDFVNDSYLVVDLRLGLRRTFGNAGVDLFLGLNNLFDTRYNGSIVPNAFGDRFFEPAAGRTWYFGIGVPVTDAGR